MKRAYINATIINGNEHCEVLEKGSLVVDENGDISAVGTADEVTIPNGYQVVDLDGKYIMPGLINAHIHFFTEGKKAKKISGKTANRFFKFVHSKIGRKLITKQYKKLVGICVNSGVTTAREVGSFFANDVAMRELITQGKIDGPRIIACGSMITTTGGHGEKIPGTIVADEPWEFIKAVRKNYQRKVDGIKICSTGGVADAKFVGEAGLPHMTVEEITAVCKEAHKRGYIVASHCESTQGIRDALQGGVDTIEHGADIEEDMVELFLNNPNTLRGYTSLIPTIAAGSALYLNRDHLEESAANEILIENARLIMEGCIAGLQKAVKYGIKVGIGTDASVPGVTQYNTWTELAYFKHNTDLSNKRIIEIATKDTAEIIGVGKITGTLDVGKAADFIVLDKNPLDDLKNIRKPRHVIASGRFIDKPQYKQIDDIKFGF